MTVGRYSGRCVFRHILKGRLGVWVYTGAYGQWCTRVQGEGGAAEDEEATENFEGNPFHAARLRPDRCLVKRKRVGILG